MNLSFLILGLAGALYLAAFLLYLRSFLAGPEKPSEGAHSFLRIGFLIHTFFFFIEAKSEGLLLPISSFGGIMAFFSWALAFIYLVLLARAQNESFGIILTLLLIFLTGAGLSRFDAGTGTHLPSPMNPYFVLHLGTAFFAYASFTLSFAAALLYLMQQRALKRKKGGTFYQRLPSLEVLEGLIYQPMAWGVFLLGLAIGVGLLWSKSAFGSYWLWETKTLTTIGIAFFYLGLIFFHYRVASHGKRSAVMSLVAFGFLCFNFFGMSLIGKGFHQLLK